MTEAARRHINSINFSMKENTYNLAGMTVNERLFACNLFDDFDNAIKTKNKNRFIEILKTIEVDDLSTNNLLLKYDLV